jgi:hypothetical protein
MPFQWSSKEWLEQKLKKPHKWPMLACYPWMVKSGPNAGDTYLAQKEIRIYKWNHEGLPPPFLTKR